MSSDKFWEVGKDGRLNNKGPPVGTTYPNRRKKLGVKKGSKQKPASSFIPEGTELEMSIAYNQARGYQARIIDYADKEDLPQEVLDHQRRIFHFTKHGPRKGFFCLHDNVKLFSADVLYILTAKVPKKLLAKKFNVAEGTIQRIRNGERNEWLDEYHLVKRIRTALYGKFKKNFKEKHITTLSDGKTNKVIAFFSSKRKARDYRRFFVRKPLNKNTEEVEKIEESGELDLLYPIEERSVTE